MNGVEAHIRVALAVKRGEIFRPDVCQVCGTTVQEIRSRNEGYPEAKSREMMVAHHWRGYDYPLDVWWVCGSCNRRLIKHDGSVTLEEARELVKPFGGWFKHELERRKANRSVEVKGEE